MRKALRSRSPRRIPLRIPPVRRLDHEDVVGLGLHQPVQRAVEGEVADVLDILPRLGPYEEQRRAGQVLPAQHRDRKSTRLNSSHGYISYAVFCLKKKKNKYTSKRVTQS